jgi:hypothetical protein
VYAAAIIALEKCSRIDECKDWADKAEAIGSYARQAENEELHQIADRIKARAIRRCGELLMEIAPAKNQQKANSRTCTGAGTSRSQVARDAGLSKRQKVTSLRVVSIPTDERKPLPAVREGTESPDPRAASLAVAVVVPCHYAASGSPYLKSSRVSQKPSFFVVRSSAVS